MARVIMKTLIKIWILSEWACPCTKFRVLADRVRIVKSTHIKNNLFLTIIEFILPDLHSPTLSWSGKPVQTRSLSDLITWITMLSWTLCLKRESKIPQTLLRRGMFPAEEADCRRKDTHRLPWRYFNSTVRSSELTWFPSACTWCKQIRQEILPLSLEHYQEILL